MARSVVIAGLWRHICVTAASLTRCSMPVANGRARSAVPSLRVNNTQLFPSPQTTHTSSRPVKLLLRFTLAWLPTLCPTRFWWSVYGGKCIFLENLSSSLFRSIGSHPRNYALSQTRRPQSYSPYSQYSMVELIMQSFLFYTFNFYRTCLVSAMLLSPRISNFGCAV